MTRLLAPDVPFAPRRVPIYYGWVVVCATIVGVVCSIPGQTMGVSAFTDHLLSATGLARLDLSNAYLLGTLGSASLLPFAGRLIDRFGVRAGALAACAVLGLALQGLSRADLIADRIAESLALPRRGVSMAVLAVLFFGIRFSGQGVMTLSSNTMLARWFRRRRGLAVGISSTTIAFAFASAPTLLGAWIEHSGWRGAWQEIAWVEWAVMACLAWILFREDPESCGLQLDGRSPPRRDEPALPVEAAATRAEALATPAFWILALAVALWGMVITAITLHIVDLGAEAGRDRSQALALFLPMAVVSTSVGAWTGWRADRMRVRTLILLLLAAEAVGFGAAAHLGNGAGFWIAATALGACGGLFSVVQTVGMPRYFGRLHLASITSVSMSLIVVGSALGPSALALSKSLSDSYRPGLYLFALLPVCLALFAWRVRHPLDVPPLTARISRGVP